MPSAHIPGYAQTKLCPLCGVDVVRWDGKLFDYASLTKYKTFWRGKEHVCPSVGKRTDEKQTA